MLQMYEKYSKAPNYTSVFFMKTLKIVDFCQANVEQV